MTEYFLIVYDYDEFRILKSEYYPNESIENFDS